MCDPSEDNRTRREEGYGACHGTKTVVDIRPAMNATGLPLRTFSHQTPRYFWRTRRRDDFHTPRPANTSVPDAASRTQYSNPGTADDTQSDTETIGEHHSRNIRQGNGLFQRGFARSKDILFLISL